MGAGVIAYTYTRFLDTGQCDSAKSSEVGAALAAHRALSDYRGAYKEEVRVKTSRDQ
jgi:hypothetical protein